MKTALKTLGLIPARGGSKGIPKKNIAPLLGKPLIGYTIEAAQQSERLSMCILSTDDAEIAAAAEGLGLEVPFMRPPELAGDNALILPVIQHALEWVESERDFRPDAVALLQPTSPLRTAVHIDEAIRIMEEEGADTVVSVVEVPHNFSPTSVMKLEEGWLAPYEAGEMILRRQDKPRVYARNGPAVLVCRREVLAGGSLYGEQIAPLVMGAVESLDIDAPIDLELAEFYLSRQQGG